MCQRIVAAALVGSEVDGKSLQQRTRQSFAPQRGHTQFLRHDDDETRTHIVEISEVKKGVQYRQHFIEAARSKCFSSSWRSILLATFYVECSLPAVQQT